MLEVYSLVVFYSQSVCKKHVTAQLESHFTLKRVCSLSLGSPDELPKIHQQMVLFSETCFSCFSLPKDCQMAPGDTQDPCKSNVDAENNDFAFTKVITMDKSLFCLPGRS